MGKHAIIVIKNKNNEYLQYFDNRWDTLLFPNCKLIEQFNNNVADYVSEILNIDQDYIRCIYIEEKVHTKFSESAKRMKEYDHFIYSVELIKMPEIMIQKNFNINGVNYIWCSYSELINNERIQKVNGDIVGFIKQLNL